MDGYDFQVIYHPGAKNGKLDVLSRRTEHRPKKGGQDYQPVNYVLKLGQWVPEDSAIPRILGEIPEIPGNASIPVSSIIAMRYYGEFVLSSVQSRGLRPVVKMSKWLEEEIVTKVADDSV